MAGVQVVDVFCYNGEPIVARRLAYLCAKVTKFIVIEARHTHAGVPKPFLFTEKHRDVFEPYADKIEFIIIDEFPAVPPNWAYALNSWIRNNVDAWWREAYQRDAAVASLVRLGRKHRFIALVCDSDEIPSVEAIEYLVAHYDDTARYPAIHLAMRFYYYSWKWTMPEPWHKAFAITDAHVTESTSLTQLRNDTPVALIESDGGWHCSFFMDAATIVEKIHAFAHREFDRPDIVDEERISRCIEAGLDVFGCDAQTLVPTSTTDLAAVPFAV